MKNIHILPSETPSDLMKCIKSFEFHVGTAGEDVDREGNFILGVGESANLKYYQWQNMYITSDEVPKLDEWGINTRNNVVFKCKGFTPDEEDKIYDKKIISTTDSKLIRSGIKKISRKFLKEFIFEEWLEKKLEIGPCKVNTPKEPSNIENDASIKQVLTSVSFDTLHEARRNFAYSNNRYPTVIVMHPSDGEKFIELMHKEFGHSALPNLMSFQGMQMIRSLDVEVGKWRLY